MLGPQSQVPRTQIHLHTDGTFAGVQSADLSPSGAMRGSMAYPRTLQHMAVTTPATLRSEADRSISAQSHPIIKEIISDHKFLKSFFSSPLYSA